MTLLDEVIDAHGGSRRWNKAKEIRAHVHSGGLLPRLKGTSAAFAEYGLSVSTAEPSAVLEPFPKPGHTGLFTGDRVQIIAADGGTVKEREHAREAFFGLSGLSRKARWDKLDGLYFAGYAMWNYLNLPWLLAGSGIETEEREGIEVEGEEWRRLDATFPEGFHTHSREQSFYFDPRGLLRRHDYHPDVVSKLANGVHLSEEHREFDGLVFPTKRRVVPRGPTGKPLPGPTVVRIELDSIKVT